MFWILLFVVVMYAIGFYHYRRIEDSDEYLVSSWNVGFWPIVGTVVATWTGSAAFVGTVGLGYSFGVSGFTRFALPAVFVSLVLCLVFASRIRRTKLYTLPDVFDERFGKPTGILPAILQAFIYAVPTLALQIVAMGFLFQTLFGIQLWVSLVVSWAIISGYTLLGGLPSVILTDSIQSIVLLVGIVLMGVATWVYAGGISEIVPAVPESHFTFLGADPLDTIFFALSIGPFYLVWQSTWQRFYASRTEGIARWGGFTGFFFAGVVLSVVSTAIGLSARTFLKGEIEPDAVFYTVLQQVLPPFLGGILAMGLMAALIAAALVYAATIFATALAVPWQELVASEPVWGTGEAVAGLFGGVGIFVLAVALSMGIFTGLNGFYVSSSRLMFAMGRARILPDVFAKLHPRYGTPYAGIIFTCAATLIAPWFGRQALLWVVDMSAVGVTIAYFYTCFAAFKLFRWSADDSSEGSALEGVVSPVKKLLSLLGAISGLSFLGLLLIPGAPGFLSPPSWIALFIWVALGVIFYLSRSGEYRRIPKPELDYLVFGEKPEEVAAKIEEKQESGTVS